MIRTISYWVLTFAFVGMGICDILKNKPRIGIAAILIGIANALIYWRT